MPIEIPPHLGGHQGITWTDEAVLDYLTERYHVRTMLDVGCGPGGMLDLAGRKGITALGIDGDPRIVRPDVLIHDYTTGPFSPPAWFDLVWCVEFVEHVEEQYIPNYLATFDAGHALFLTAAYPGQGGWHHVNEQPMNYWTAVLFDHHWQIDNEATLWVRGNGEIPFAKMTGMVFTKLTGQSS